jgi:hypothetical protein
MFYVSFNRESFVDLVREIGHDSGGEVPPDTEGHWDETILQSNSLQADLGHSLI